MTSSEATHFKLNVPARSLRNVD